MLRLTSDLCRQAVEDPVAKLSERIQQFDKEASATQKTQLQTSEADFQTILEQAKGKQDAKLAKDANASKWRSKLQSGLATFCKTAQHYQKILDVLTEQAPEYTSAIWGAIKILLISSINHEKLKHGVISALDTVGDQFALMKVIVDLQPSDLMVQTVTAAYSDFVKFLNKAVKYYTQCRGCKYMLYL